MKNTKTLVIYALLTAIIVIMSFTPLGYFRTGTIEITLLTIPVIIGAIILGPVAGAFMGGIFGITSFIQCFGLSPFGTMLLGINPVFTFIVCFFPRVLMGWLCGVIFKTLKGKSADFVSFSVASLSGALLNTVLFMTALMLSFGRTEFIQSLNPEGLSVVSFVIAFVGINGLIEAVACFIVGTAISRSVYKYANR